VLTIRDSQIDKLGENITNTFINDSIYHVKKQYPEFCQERDEDDLKAVIAELIDYALDKHIYQKNNIINFVSWKVELGFTIPLSEFNAFRLGRKDFSEDYRMNQLYRSITSGYDLQLISLDSKLQNSQ